MRILSLDLVFQDGSTPVRRAPTPVMARISQGEDVRFRLQSYNEDGSVRNITGHSFVLGISNPATGVSVLSRIATLTTPAAGVCDVIVNDTDSLTWGPGVYQMNVWSNDGTNDWQPLPSSTLNVTSTSSLPGAVTTTPTASMVLVGVPVPAAGDVGKVLSVQVLTPLTLAFVAQSGGGGGGSAITPTALKTSAYTAANYQLVRCNPTGGGFTVTLPAATTGTVVMIKNQSNSTNTVTVAGAGADTIDGAASFLLSLSRAGATFYSDGVSDWMVE